MRVFAYLCFACAVAAKAPVGDFDGESVRFLASKSPRSAASSLAGGEVGEYERETQSPMVWLNLRKSNLGVKSLWPSIGHVNAAARDLGEPYAA